MTLPDPGLDRPGGQSQSTPDVVPPTERNQDPARTAYTRELTTEPARPLTGEERAAAENDWTPGERVYAPASERVPVEPVPGHRAFVEHPDPATPERRAAEQRGYTPARPTQAVTSYAAYPRRGLALSAGLGWLALTACGGIGIWLFVRWQRERNKPINRMRRQARQAAQEIREHVPAPDEVGQPAVGLGAALLSTLLVIWRQSRAHKRAAQERRAEIAIEAATGMSDGDWQRRLIGLKARWSPRRVELEKFTISKR